MKSVRLASLIRFRTRIFGFCLARDLCDLPVSFYEA